MQVYYNTDDFSQNGKPVLTTVCDYENSRVISFQDKKLNETTDSKKHK